MVYYLSWKTDEMPCLPSAWEKYLPAHRIEKALAYKQEKDKTTSVLAFLLLRYALFKEYAVTAMPQIETDENGKPFAVNGEYHFNLSHCDTAVACAVDVSPVGVDVQDFRPVGENVVKKVCSEAEQMRMLESRYDEQLFAAFWASKEAYGKNTGCGIGYNLKEYSFCPYLHFPQDMQYENHWIQTQVKDDYSLSVCACTKQQFTAVNFDSIAEILSVLDRQTEKI